MKLLTDAYSNPSFDNPLDIAEDILNANNWDFNRCDEDELLVELQGRWTDYTLYFLWRHDIGALYFSLSFDARIPSQKKEEMYKLVALVNEKMWMGHFDLISGDDVLMFRHTLLLRGSENPSVEQIEDLIDCALMETDRFYPAFQYLMWGGQSAGQCLSMVEFETIGEA